MAIDDLDFNALFPEPRCFQTSVAWQPTIDPWPKNSKTSGLCLRIKIGNLATQWRPRHPSLSEFSGKFREDRSLSDGSGSLHLETLIHPGELGKASEPNAALCYTILILVAEANKSDSASQIYWIEFKR